MKLWSERLVAASQMFQHNPRIKDYLITAVTQGRNVQWSVQSWRESTVASAEWAVKQYRLMKAGKLSLEEGTKIEVLFTPERKEEFRIVPPAVPPVRRRPSFG